MYKNMLRIMDEAFEADLDIPRETTNWFADASFGGRMSGEGSFVLTFPAADGSKVGLLSLRNQGIPVAIVLGADVLR